MARISSGVGSMAAVLGLDYDEVARICEELSEEDSIIEPANINSPGQIVVSGHKTAIDRIVEQGKSLGAKRVLPLNVSGPFHSSMMQVIEKDFEDYINQFEWHDAEIPVVQNYHAQAETDAEVIKQNMVKQLLLTSSIYQINRMVNRSRCRPLYRNRTWQSIVWFNQENQQRC